MSIINCPRCNKILRFEKPRDLPYFPFCSKQCRLVDLDQWFEEDHRISDPLPEPEEDDADA